jgi:hypothetical protein
MPDAKPNILFIMADQLAARYLKAYGHGLVKTPHLDRRLRTASCSKTLIRRARSARRRARR